MANQNERKGLGKASTEVKAPANGRAPSGDVGGAVDDGIGAVAGVDASASAGASVTNKVSLFDRVPEKDRLAWPDIAAILSGVVSSLSKLMGGGIVAFYAGCQMGGVTVAITFALSFVLTYLVGKICFREGLPNNVVSRYYIFGRKGSAAGSLIWIFVLVGVLAVGTVQLGNAILFAFGWEGEVLRWALFIGISCVWVVMALFGTKIIARMNAVFVVARGPGRFPGHEVTWKGIEHVQSGVQEESFEDNRQAWRVLYKGISRAWGGVPKDPPPLER